MHVHPIFTAASAPNVCVQREKIHLHTCIIKRDQNHYQLLYHVCINERMRAL